VEFLVWGLTFFDCEIWGSCRDMSYKDGREVQVARTDCCQVLQRYKAPT
jgi:hypothetical protein